MSFVRALFAAATVYALMAFCIALVKHFESAEVVFMISATINTLVACWKPKR